MRKVLIIPDCHVRSHDPKLWELILAYASANEWTDLVQLGDFLDLESLNFHNIGKPGKQEGQRLEKEISAGREALTDLVFASRRCNPAAEAHLVFGNHEDRLSRYLDAHPELMGSLSLSSALDLASLGVRSYPYVKHRAPCRIGKLHFIHGSYEGSGAVARTLSDLNCNFVCGHLHRLEIRTKPSQHGTMLGACIGFAGRRDLGNNYLKGPAGWTQGFAVAYIRPSGDFNLYPVVYTNGEFVAPDGTIYSSRSMVRRGGASASASPAAPVASAPTTLSTSTTPASYRGQSRSRGGRSRAR